MYFWNALSSGTFKLVTAIFFIRFKSGTTVSEVDRLFLWWTETHVFINSFYTKMKSISWTRIAVCTGESQSMYIWMLYPMELSNLSQLSSLSGLSQVRLFLWWTETYLHQSSRLFLWWTETYFHQSSLKTNRCRPHEFRNLSKS
jgi:hypothetical protein